ncbi:MAG: hypothetical protein HOP21_12270, partial [Methylotenera sp.]|nr:hypothetical protein [Methylotenera sp.]
TLWRVAERAKQTGFSVEQMMVAMYEANPDAINQQNVHALLAGKNLKIPTKDAILKY